MTDADATDAELGDITTDDLRHEYESTDIEETDLDGDGVTDLVTTTTKRHQPLRFGPGSPKSGWIKTEVEVGQCDEDHDGVNDWVAVTAVERIHVDLDGDGTVDLKSHTERVSHDFDGDGIADLVTTKIVEEVAVTDDRSGERRVVRTEHQTIDVPPEEFDPLDTPKLTPATPEAVRERLSRIGEPLDGVPQI